MLFVQAFLIWRTIHVCRTIFEYAIIASYTRYIYLVCNRHDLYMYMLRHMYDDVTRVSVVHVKNVKLPDDWRVADLGSTSY